MRILSNTTVDTTINGINLTTLNNQVSTNTTNISSKANTSDLPVGIEDQASVGKLVSINVDPVAGTIALVFEGAEYTISDLVIS